MYKFIRSILIDVLIFTAGILIGLLKRITYNNSCDRTRYTPCMNKLEAQDLIEVIRTFQGIKQVWLTQIQGNEIWCIDVAMNDGNFKQIHHWSELEPII